MIGRTISHYRIISKLGEGGMGVVYEAEDLKLDRRVALKFLPPHLQAEDAAKNRFVHEAKAASALDHPNIGTIYEIDETPAGQMFIAMALYDGGTLKQKAEGNLLSASEAVDIVSQVARGLAKAHDSGIVHRDVKPGNILMTTDGLAKLVDFGLAKLSGASRVTRTGTTVGTVAYMSPEQARGEEVDPRSDVFSLGVVLYELLTGKLPFRGDHEAAVIYAILNMDPEPLDTHRPDLPAGLQNVIDKALSKDADSRYASARELVGDLKAVLGGGEVGAVRRRRRKISRRTVVAAAAVAVVVIAGYVLYTQLGPRLSDQQPAVSTDVIAVFPFTVRGSEDVAFMGEGVVDLLSMKLNGVGGLRSVHVRALMSLIQQDGGEGELDPQRYRAIAERAGAGLYVTGSIVEAGGRITLRASVLETTGGAEAESEASAEGRTDRFQELVDELAAELVVKRVAESGTPLALLARETTDSYEALAAYLEAERLYRSTEYSRSVEACQRAVAADSTFALAYYRMQRAAMVTGMAESDPDALAKAMRYREPLPDNERRLIEALHAWIEEWDAEESLRLLRANVSRRPDDIESRLMLGEVLFLYGKRQNLWLDEAKANFERILYYNPDDTEAISNLWWLAGIRGDYEESNGWARRWLELSPDADQAPFVRAALAYTSPDTTRRMEMLAELEDYNDVMLGLAVHGACLSGALEGAARIARIMTDPSRPPETRGRGYRVIASLAFARGRWEEADASLAEAESYGARQAIRDRANLSLTPPAPFPRSLLEASLAGVTDQADTRGKNPTHRPYLAGLLSARLGDYPAALRHAAEVDSMALARRAREDPHSREYAEAFSDMARTIRAEVAWLQGHHERALDEIEQTHPEALWFWTNASVIDARTYSRYLRALLLEEAGRLEEALRWYGSLEGSGDGYVYFAAKHLKMGEVYERMGDGEKAATHYARFIELLHDCDPEFRPLVDDVRERIARLRA
jgi:tetratricopeptide (TPR) repeat protein